MQLTLLPSFYNVTVLLSGVKSPIYRKDIPDQPDLIEPFAAEVSGHFESPDFPPHPHPIPHRHRLLPRPRP